MNLGGGDPLCTLHRAAGLYCTAGLDAGVYERCPIQMIISYVLHGYCTQAGLYRAGPLYLALWADASVYFMSGSVYINLAHKPDLHCCICSGA